MNVHILPEAESDLSDALDYYLESAPIDIAIDLQHEVRRVAALLAELPRLGRPLGHAVRAFGLTRFPYTVVYTISADTLVIVAIAHQRRDPRYWRSRL